ncbi:MAG: hypothetical protein RLP44_19795 [Aggregatilineales bacterium]
MPHQKHGARQRTVGSALPDFGMSVAALARRRNPSQQPLAAGQSAAPC